MVKFFKGENELYKMIKDDHEKIQSALEQIENSAQSDRPHLFATLVREMVPHMKAEEKAFYPILKSNLRTHEDALISAEEHRVAESLLDEMKQSSEMDETWKAKSTVLRTIIDHHFRMEEGRVFDDADKAIPEDHLKDIARSYQEEKTRVQSGIITP